MTANVPVVHVTGGFETDQQRDGAVQVGDFESPHRAEPPVVQRARQRVLAQAVLHMCLISYSWDRTACWASVMHDTVRICGANVPIQPRSRYEPPSSRFFHVTNNGLWVTKRGASERAERLVVGTRRRTTGRRAGGGDRRRPGCARWPRPGGGSAYLHRQVVSGVGMRPESPDGGPKHRAGQSAVATMRRLRVGTPIAADRTDGSARRREVTSAAACTTR